MQQYFVKEELTLHQDVLLDQEQAHHVQHVLRMKEGSVIRIANFQKQVYLAHVCYRDKQVMAHLDARIEVSEYACRISLAAALIKGDKWDFLLQKVCELGAYEIQPFISKRCVVKVKDEKKEKKIQRWNKIALEACEQCKRSDVAVVHETCALSEVGVESYDLKLVAYENADHIAMKLKDTLEHHPNAQRILCVVGPEGGFEEAEIADLMARGFQCVSLGERILRAETAALSMVNTLSFFYDC